MKKLLLILSMVLFTFSVQAQEEEKVCLRLGYTYSEIEADAPNLELRSTSTEEEIKAIQKTDEVWVFYFFNSDKVCNEQVYMYQISRLKNVIKSFLSDSKFIKIQDLEYIYINDESVLQYTIEIDSENEVIYLGVVEV